MGEVCWRSKQKRSGCLTVSRLVDVIRCSGILEFVRYSASLPDNLPLDSMYNVYCTGERSDNVTNGWQALYLHVGSGARARRRAEEIPSCARAPSPALGPPLAK